MHEGRLLALVEVLGDQPLSVAVEVEVYRSGGNNADEVGAEALEESSGAFGTLDGDEDLERFMEVEGDGSKGVCRLRSGQSVGRTQFLLVDARLKPGFED